MYDYIHNNISQFIILCTDYEFTTSVYEFSTFYFAHFYQYISHQRFDDEYIQKLINYDIVARLTKIANEYNFVDKVSFNILITFLTKYVCILNTQCENCKCEILDIDTVCLNCGCFIKNIACYNTKRNGYYPSCQKHNPSKHCEKWLLQLQGKETIFIPCDSSHLILLSAQEDYNKRNGNIVFNCDLIRAYLKKLRLTQYNSNISYIRKYIERNLNIPCNESYYDLSYEEINHIMVLFNSIQNKYEELCSNPEVLSRINKKSIHNNLYYPFYLEKILNLIIGDKQRLEFILSNIHRQSKKTINKNDILWSLIIPTLSL
jgi:hypothetical protein